MTKLQDFTILLTAKEVGLVIPNYRADQSDPLKLVPDFPPCIHNNLEVKTEKCGRVTCRFRCLLTNESISPPHCNTVCTVRDSGS